MFFLPLGPGHRPPFFPIMTVCLAGTTIVFSIFHFSYLREYSSRLNETLIKNGVPEKMIAFSKEYCPTQKMEPAKCELAEKIIKLTFLEDKARQKEAEKIFSQMTEDKKTKEKGRAKPDRKIASEQRASLEDAANYIAKLREINEVNNPKFASIGGYQEFVSSLSESSVELSPYQTKYSILTSGNINWRSLAVAQFSHEGWMHLIMNMVVFLSFMVYLEQRSQIIGPLLIYFIGGSVGLVLELMRDHSSMVPLMGASANIAAVMGAYLVFYFRHNTRFLFSIGFVYYRVIEAPTALMILILFPLMDLAAVLQESVSTSHVAHVAHLGGFATGALLAFGIKKFERLKEPFIYGIEWQLFESAEKIKDLIPKMKIYSEILSYNPTNSVVIKNAFGAICENQNLQHEQHVLVQPFINKYFSSLFEVDHSVIAKVPPEISLVEALEETDANFLSDLAGKYLERGIWFNAIRLYDAYRFQNHNTVNAIRIQEAVEAAMRTLQDKGEDLGLLRRYLVAEPRSTFRDLNKYIRKENLYGKLGTPA